MRIVLTAALVAALALAAGSAAAAEPKPLTIGDVVTGQVRPTGFVGPPSCDVYAFKGEAGERLLLETDSEEKRDVTISAPNLLLARVVATQIGKVGKAVEEITLTVTGRHVVFFCSSWRSKGGAYSFKLTRQGAGSASPTLGSSVLATAPSAGPAAAEPSARKSKISRAAAQPRVALVIGNGAYKAEFGALANPVNDARAMAAALKEAGFDVEVVTNADQKIMKRAISRLGQRLNAAGRGSTGLFFYAGHGVQSRGVNYLVPIGAAIETEADIDLEAVAADAMLRQMEEAGASTNIVILDACRNLPVQRSFRDGARGLARMDAPNGSFVAYSTAPGSVAADGSGSNSPFVTALLSEIQKPGQPIETTFRNVRKRVLTATAGKQTPWDSSSLVDSFAFNPGD